MHFLSGMPAQGCVRNPKGPQQGGRMSSEEASSPKVVGNERRKRNIPVAIDRRNKVGGERRKAERRRQVDPTTCERDYNDSEIDFMKAMDQYKRDNRRPFPTWSEVLEVLHSLGYRKVAEPTALPGLQPSLPPKG
jgi:hypothetical protein